MISTGDLLAKARWQASKKVPYLSRSLWAMTFHESTELETLGIDDKWRVYVNPAYVLKCAKEDTLVGEVIHECLHPTLRHKPRALAIHATDAKHWNRCGDAELDQRIEEIGGVKLVENRIQPEHLGGTDKMTAEELYRLPRPKSPKGGGKGEPGTCGGGSGATGKPAPWEKPKPGSGPGITEAEADLIRAAVAHDVRKFVEARGRGSVPAGILRWAEEFGEPAPVDWRSLVSARVRYAIDSRRGAAPSYARPARRTIPGGLVLPVHRLPIPNIFLVLDTSGSMGDDDIGAGLACVWDACEVLGRVSVVSCDADASEPVEIRHVDELQEHLRGGGGTDMCVGIDRAAERNPDAIVVVTDGDTPWPEDEPDVPLVIVLTRDTHCDIPPWADVVRVPEIEAA
jgi:predicted metal-dependent peptidase